MPGRPRACFTRSCTIGRHGSLKDRSADLNAGQNLFAAGIGVGTKNAKGEWLEVYFPAPLFRPAAEVLKDLAAVTGYQGGNVTISLTDGQRYHLRRLGKPYAALATAAKPVAAVFLAEDLPPASVPETYLKLHLLSHRLVKPRSINLDGLFRVLVNVAWTSRGPVDVTELAALQLDCRLRGEPLVVHMVDKFPRLTDYVVPPNVRIADTARVRLGAYLGSGTVVLHEGFVSFNAGTEGPNLIDGRINPGIWVGRDSRLGGGSSMMGTLSGGGAVVVSIGRNCLIGANAGVGIPLGDDCTVEAGLYVTAGSKVSVLDGAGRPLRTVKALDLAGESGLLFRRNSENGRMECLPRSRPPPGSAVLES